MTLQEAYNNNADFKEYVDKFCKKHNKTVSEALMNAVVFEYYIYLEENHRK